MNAKEIVNKTFEAVKKGGYKTEEVDEYLRDVSVEFKKLQSENEELEKKIEVLAAKIREYREDEDALREALLIAKKQGIAVVNEAKEQAAAITKEAKEKAEKTVKDANDAAQKRKEQADKDEADAKAKVAKLIADGNAKADEIHTQMMQRTEREQIVLQRTRQEVAEYTQKILSAYNVHIENIKSIPRQCENEFVISTSKEVESRKPQDSAFAKKPVTAEASKKEEPKPAVKEEAKPEVKEEAKPEVNEEQPVVAEDKPEIKEEVKSAEGKAAQTEAAEPKADEKNVTGNSILFKLGSDKNDSGSHSALEFGQKK